MKRSDVTNDSPIVQFQNTLFERDDIYKLLHSINNVCGNDGLSEGLLEKAFSMWWPNLEEKLNAIDEPDPNIVLTAPIDGAAQQDRSTQLLEDILETVRSQQRLLTSPSELVPPEYLINTFFSAQEFIQYADPSAYSARVQNIQSLSLLAMKILSELSSVFEQVLEEGIRNQGVPFGDEYETLNQKQKETLQELHIAIAKIRLSAMGLTRPPLPPSPIK